MIFGHPIGKIEALVDAEARARNEGQQMRARSEHEALGVFMHE